MKNKKMVSLALVLALGVGTLTGCGNKNAEIIEESTGAIVAEETIAVSNNKNFQTFEEIPESKEYEPYEHVFFQRYNNYWDLNGGTIVIPDGYEMIDIKYYDQKTGYGAQSNYLDLWLTNTLKVVVEPLYNERTNTYDYSQPGTIVELDETNKLTK